MSSISAMEGNELPLPSHWKAPSSRHPLFGPIPLLLFQGLCLISVRRPSLNHHWKAQWDDKEWAKHMGEMVGQINNSNVAWITFGNDRNVFNVAASRAILNYATSTSYVLTLVSFADALGGLLIGTAVIAIYQSCDRDWAREVLTATRLRLYLILLLMAWPSVSLFVSIIFLMASILLAVFAPGFVWLHAAIGLELVSWVWTLPAFIFCTLPLRKRQNDREVQDQPVQYVGNLTSLRRSQNHVLAQYAHYSVSPF